jgi:hypothetical protein
MEEVELFDKITIEELAEGQSPSAVGRLTVL